MFGFDNLSLRDLAALCTEIIDSTRDAATMEDAASRMVRCLRHVFGTQRHGRTDIVLARAFLTVAYADLPDDVRAYVDRRLSGSEPPERCLALLGTDGDLPQWSDRRGSVDHQAIPLSSPEAVKAMPMVSALVDDLGVSMSTFLHGMEGLDVERLGHDLGVFFVPDAPGSAEVPGQDFVARHGVRSVVGFGGLLPGGDLFCIILFTRTPIADDVAHLFRTVAVAAKLALLSAATAPLFPGQPPRHVDRGRLDAARIRALEQLLDVQQQTVTYQAAHLERVLDEALRSRAAAHREAAANEVLREVTSTLSAELETDRLLRAATDAATRITGADFGAFCHQDPRVAPETTYTLSGIPRDEFDAWLDQPLRDRLGPALRHGHVVLHGDIRAGVPSGEPAPGRPDVRSYLAVPVTAREGRVIGCFLLGSTAPEVFDERAERLVVGIAAQTAIALDNARLFSEQRRTALALQQSLLPQQVLSPVGLDIGHAYLPGGEGVDVGGDWYDVIPIAGSRTAFVIGDVMGKGVHAAAVMGQLRTAIRAYAVTELAPATLMAHLNRLVLDMAQDLIATCVYAVLDQTDGSLVVASAGHIPPAFVNPRGAVELPDLQLGPPLGVEGAVYLDERMPFPVDTRMLLFTDGLVEHRERDLEVGLDALVGNLASTPGRCSEVCRALITALLEDRTQDDDITLLMVANQGLSRQEHRVRHFPPVPEEAAAVRTFVEETLDAWGDASHALAVVAVVNELFINAVAHARTRITVHLRRLPHVLVAEVEDLSGHEPRRSVAGPDDEHHRGLQIVDVLSTRWGSRRTETGKVVWAEFSTA